MSTFAKGFAFTIAGFAVMIFANFYIGETLAGWATLFAGLCVYSYGWRDVCPGCRARRCNVKPAKDLVEPRG